MRRRGAFLLPGDGKIQSFLNAVFERKMIETIKNTPSRNRV
jgi:hypothetical protein